MMQIFRSLCNRAITIALVVLLSFGVMTVLAETSPAIAAIREFEEKPGQTVYQARQTLKDQAGRTWQAIAFKRIKPDGTASLNLRLVGFPGSVSIDRQQPLQLSNSLGEVLTAEDASSKIFSDADAPEPHIGQYDLQPILADLRLELPWRLTLPTEAGDAVALSLPPSFLQEWQALSQKAS
jgi:hypothetical protein